MSLPPPYPPPTSTEPDEFFCLTCGRFSHPSYAVVQAHHAQCRDKRVWCCKACRREFMDYREAEDHVYQHWRAIEEERRQHEQAEEMRRKQVEEQLRKDMQDRAQALLRSGHRATDS